MSALIRRYGCLYTSEAHKHPRNRRQHDGYVTIHHYNASAVLWSETDRQLKWTLLSRSDLKRKTCELQASGISEAYRLADDEEVVFGGGWVARVSGECVHESQQDFSQLDAAKNRKRAESAAWRAEALQEDQPPPEKKSKLNASPSGPGKGQDVKMKGTPAQVQWRQSKGSMIGVSPKLQPLPTASSTDAAASPARREQGLEEGPSSRARSSGSMSASALPRHLRKSYGTSVSSEKGDSGSSHGHSRTGRLSVDLKVSPKLLRPFKAPSRKSL